jgi:hypothetical protein
VYIAVDITAAAIMAITVRMATMAMPIVPTDITAIGDTATMVAIGPIAGTGRGVHIVDGADRRPYEHIGADEGFAGSFRPASQDLHVSSVCMRYNS